MCVCVCVCVCVYVNETEEAVAGVLDSEDVFAL